jgi:oxygen-independent coproporphyrinogen III oxidase
MQPFVSERFVSVTGKLISLSEQGRPFVRLIASVFDSYLQESGNRHSVAV